MVNDVVKMWRCTKNTIFTVEDRLTGELFPIHYDSGDHISDIQYQKLPKSEKPHFVPADFQVKPLTDL